METRILKFIQNANKSTLDMEPHRPELLNMAFTQLKECHDTYRKKYHNGIKISLIWESNLTI